MFLRTRFAPTPSGFLHPGNLLNLAICWRVVHGSLPAHFEALHAELAVQAETIAMAILNALPKTSGGELLLRIDDLDHERVRDAYLHNISQTLNTYGFQPANINPQVPDTWKLARQSSRIAQFETFLHRVEKLPGIFACTCSRAQAGTGPYPGTCRRENIPLNTPGAAWRIDVPDEMVVTVPDLLLGSVQVPIGRTSGCYVIRKRDGIPAYQLASVADDESMGINLVIRGIDLLESTARQLYLAGQMGLSGFRSSEFAHHHLLMDQHGQKLSKSNRPLL